jgi:DNA-binding SARP family transcriptional activator
MDFRILGTVEAHSGGHEVKLAGQRQRGLLAYLLLHANEAVSSHRLLDELWTTPPVGGLAALQRQVSRLRKLLDDRIASTTNGYTLRVEPGELDLDRFRWLLAEAGASLDPNERAARLREADSLCAARRSKASTRRSRRARRPHSRSSVSPHSRIAWRPISRAGSAVSSSRSSQRSWGGIRSASGCVAI